MRGCLHCDASDGHHDVGCCRLDRDGHAHIDPHHTTPVAAPSEDVMPIRPLEGRMSDDRTRNSGGAPDDSGAPELFALLPPAIQFAVRLQAFADAAAITPQAVGLNGGAGEQWFLEGVNAAFLLSMAIRAAFEHPEWGQAVVRLMQADTAAPGAIRELMAALPVQITSEEAAS